MRGRALVVTVAAGAMVMVPFAAPGSAAGVSHVTCTKVSSGKLTPKGAAASVFAGCTPTALKAGGKGSTTKTPPKGSTSGQVGFKVTWNGGKGTTTAAISFKKTTIGKCPKTGGYSRLTVKGSVKAATGAAKAITKVGEPVTASQCVVASGGNAGKSMLEPGTKFKL